MRSKRRRKPGTARKRGVYLLPNLLTSAGLFSGFYAIVAALEGNFETAAIAVLIACIFDALDGRVARLTHATSHFGTEYDSLADLVAFGVAPALLLYLWALQPLGRFGWLACFMYLVCGALRLARFNVQKPTTDSAYFRGLPIPAAASFAASVVLFADLLQIPATQLAGPLVALTYVLSFLMVSTLRYYSFKTIDLRRHRPFNLLVTLILALIIITYQPKVMFFAILAAYVGSGPVVTFYLMRKHRRSAKTAAKEEAVVER